MIRVTCDECGRVQMARECPKIYEVFGYTCEFCVLADDLKRMGR